MERLTYQPNQLIDYLIAHLGLKNDAELVRKLDIQPAELSKYRHYKRTIGATFLLQVYDVFGVEIATSKKLAGLPKFVSREWI